MSRKVLLPLGVLLVSVALAACGGSSHRLPDAEVQNSAPSTQPFEGLDGLPELADLPQPGHEMNMVGPGFFPIPPEATIAEGGVAGPHVDELPLDAAVSTAYALYGAFGFDGDNGPTSARITVEDVTGQFFVSFADYVSGAWTHTGPYTATVTAEIPNVDEYSSPTAFTSPNGTCYFAVIVPLGSAVTITGVELGVHGGILGPTPPQSVSASGGPAGLVVQWVHSMDYHDPDFAGYRLERAPLLFGDFQPLVPGLILGDHHVDDTGDVDVQHRYRVAAEDVSGNTSIWRSATGGRMSADTTNPVAVLDVPQGPLFGPVDVTFDLSSSYDPEGGVIDSWEIQLLYGPPSLNGAPVLNTTLQPGCYLIVATVEVTVDARVGTTYATLVVYPRWESDSVLVRDAEPSGWDSRLFMTRGARHPDSGLVTLFGYDLTIPGFAIWQEQTGGGFELATLPIYSSFGSPGGPVSYTGEPVVLNDSILAPVAGELNFYLAAANGPEVRWVAGPVRNADSDVAAATDGVGEVWLFYSFLDGGTLRLMEYSLLTGEETVIVGDIGDDLDTVAALYDPATGMIHVVFGWWDGVDDYLEYVRWDPVNKAIEAATLPHLETVYADWADLELNPDTGRPALIYNSNDDTFNHFRELADNGTDWTADVMIDNSLPNGPPDLAFGDDRPYAVFGVGIIPAQQAYLFERVGGIWSTRNTADYSTNSAFGGALMTIPGSEDVLVADRAGTGDVYFVTAHSDDTETVHPWSQFGTDYLPGTDGQGFEMHGAGGSDGLHISWRSTITAIAQHYISPDGGTTWNDAGESGVAVYSTDVTATEDGTVYFSYCTGGDSKLAYWDGANVVDLFTIPSATPLHRPMLSGLPTDVDVMWTPYEGGTGNIHYIFGTGPNPLAYTHNVVPLADPPVWSGVINNVFYPIRASHFALADGANPDDAWLGFYNVDDTFMDRLLNPIPPEPFDFLATQQTYGRTLDASGYVGTTLNQIAEVYWATNGTLLTPIRYEVKLLEDPILTEIPMNPDFVGIDGRRTVTAALGWGYTAVGLIANLGATDVYFEWSHFGDWETLPMPDGMDYMTMPELIVGMDGRWHIIYKNFLTDQIMSRSTLP